jgi:hypothetical protein
VVDAGVVGFLAVWNYAPQRSCMKLRIIGSNSVGEDVETPVVAYYWR